MKNPLKEFSQLRAALLKRQSELQDELAAINAALGSAPAASSTPKALAPKAPAQVRTPGKRGPRKRAENSLSLAEAVFTVTKGKPLTKPEILLAVGELGYKFSAKSPMNSLNTFLYTNKQIKNFGGKFGPK
jgi:hypothetical protein